MDGHSPGYRIAAHGSRGGFPVVADTAPDAAFGAPDAALGCDPRALLAVEPARYLRRVPGRETFVWPEGGLDPAPGVARAIVKRSAVRRLAWPPCAARRELSNLRELAAAGLPVPRAIGWCSGTAGGRRVALVAMELVPHRESLRSALARVGSDERRRLAEELLAIVLGLHVRGWYHRDLYLEHVLVALPDAGGPARLVLIDVGRARRAARPRRRWLVKDVAALLHSTPAAVTPAERLRFLARYLDGRGIAGRRARRSFARAVLAKRARLAAHRPRHAHASSPEAQR